MVLRGGLSGEAAAGPDVVTRCIPDDYRRPLPQAVKAAGKPSLRAAFSAAVGVVDATTITLRTMETLPKVSGRLLLIALVIVIFTVCFQLIYHLINH